MCHISSPDGSDSDLATSGEAGDFTASFTGKDYYENLIDRANTIPLVNIFKLYGVYLDERNRKAICPFKHHKNGGESTPSFYYYSDTNSFMCFGCNTGGKHAHACEFVSAIENFSKVKAAQKILDLFNVDCDVNSSFVRENFSERLEIMMDFSNSVREFRQNFTNEKSNEFIEFICETYDKHNLKRNLDNVSLKSIVEQIKSTINSFKP